MLVACVGILEKEGGMNFFLNFILPTSAISSSAFWKLNGNINRHEIYHGSANFYLLPTSLDTKLFRFEFRATYWLLKYIMEVFLLGDTLTKVNKSWNVTAPQSMQCDNGFYLHWEINLKSRLFLSFFAFIWPKHRNIYKTN